VTRELKIALIVGFSAVLFVAILLSDHFAKVHKNALPDPGFTTPTLVGIAPSDPIKTPEALALEAEQRIAAAGGRTSVAEQMAAKQAQREQRMLESGPIVIDNTASKGSSDSLAGNFTSAMEQAKDRLVNGRAPAAVSTGSQADPHSELTQQIKNAGGDILDRGATRDIVLPAGGKPDAAQPAAKPEPSATELARSTPGSTEQTKSEAVRHMVVRNESLYDIARKYYGNGSQWKKIAEANPGRVAANGSIREGVSLVIPAAPAKADVKAAPAKDATAKPAPDAKSKPLGAGETRITLEKAKKPEAAKQEPKAEPKADPKKEPKLADSTKGKRPGTYTVRPGDTAGKISQQILGTSRRADEILELNNLQEESLRVGMVLKIPSV
jgi:nucleoid-associated protein YgaU